jgi:hypothetical protein
MEKLKPGTTEKRHQTRPVGGDGMVGRSRERVEGDLQGTERSSCPGGPKSRPAGVRASVVARKRGNARGAKGRRKVET